jgi:hypothetical protein
VNKIVKYATPKIEAGLVAIAQTLKTTVAEVYRALVMKQVAVSAGYAIIGLFSFLFMFFTYRIVMKSEEILYKSTPDSYGRFSWKPQWILSTILCVVTSIGLFIPFIINFKTMMVGFIAPEALAIQEIVLMVDTLFK